MSNCLVKYLTISKNCSILATPFPSEMVNIEQNNKVMILEKTMSNNTRKVANDSDLMILIPLAGIMSFLAIIATTVMS